MSLILEQYSIIGKKYINKKEEDIKFYNLEEIINDVNINDKVVKDVFVNLIEPSGSYFYIASPYAKYHKGKQGAYEDVLKITGQLTLKHVVAYSPIVHCHNLNENGYGLGVNWLYHDLRLLKASSGLVVTNMEGWYESFGVTVEIGYAVDNYIPIIFLHVEV